jgi:hypothetical protein
VAIGGGGSGYQTSPSANTAVLAQQAIFAPDSWQELFEIAACQRIAQWMNEGEAYDRITMALEKKITALNLTRTADMVRQEKHNERAVSLRIAQYTGAR